MDIKFEKMFESIKEDTDDVMMGPGTGMGEGEGMTARKLRQMLFDVEPQDGPLELVDSESGEVYKVESLDTVEGGEIHLLISHVPGESGEEMGEEEMEEPSMEEDELPYEGKKKDKGKMGKMGGDGKGQMNGMKK